MSKTNHSAWSIMGIDPGTVHTGYGVLKVEKEGLKCLDYGLISAAGCRSPGQPFHSRVMAIHQGIQKLCEKHKPSHLAVEKVFFAKNPDTAFKLGHIFALCLLESERQKMKFFEYATRQVKKSVTFSGNSSKELVREFVLNLLSLPKGLPLDATDALAVALCHERECQKTAVQGQILKKTVKRKGSTI